MSDSNLREVLLIGGPRDGEIMEFAEEVLEEGSLEVVVYAEDMIEDSYFGQYIEDSSFGGMLQSNPTSVMYIPMKFRIHSEFYEMWLHKPLASKVQSNPENYKSDFILSKVVPHIRGLKKLDSNNSTH